MKILYRIGISLYSKLKFMLLLKTRGNIQMSEMGTWQNYKDLCLEDPIQIKSSYPPSI